jgi:hypothetical protein
VSERRLIPLKTARERLGVSKVTMARLVKEGRFTVYHNPLDRRQKLVDEAELDAAVRPIPLEPNRTKNATETDRDGTIDSISGEAE